MSDAVPLGLSDDHISTDFVETEPVPRPTPEKSPPGVEYTSPEEIPDGMTRVVGFSGGEDSLGVTHFAMSTGLAEAVIYLDTGSGLAENLSYVRRVCERHGWPLMVLPTPMTLEEFSMKYAFSTPSSHSWAFQWFKARAIRALSNYLDRTLKVVTGVYRDESENRMKAITSEVQYESENFSGWWIAPFMDWTEDEVADYIAKHSLEKSPVYGKIHRSGDCYCMAYGHRDEVLIDLAAEYPEHFHWMMNVERRVQEYRGRLFLLRDLFPNMMEYAREDVRTRGPPPYPMMDTVLKENFPAHYRWAMNQPRGKAILRAATDPTSYFGHAKMDSDEMRALMARNDISQTSLCDDGCGLGEASESQSVERRVENAKEQVETEQMTLSGVTADE